MTDHVSISNLAAELHAHAEHCAESISGASDRMEHIRLTQIALEASRLALSLDRFISENTAVATGPVDTIALVPPAV